MKRPETIQMQMERERRYEAFLQRTALTDETLKNQRETRFDHTPLFSIWCVVNGAEPKQIIHTLQSLQAQTYERWEVCLVSDKPMQMPPMLRVQSAVLEHADDAALLQAAYDLSQGDSFLLLSAGDVIAPDMLYRCTLVYNQIQDTELIYTDEDEIDADGVRVNPQLKPRYAPDTLLSYPYIGRALTMLRSLYDRCGGLKGLDLFSKYDWILRATQCAKRVTHIPHILLSHYGVDFEPEDIHSAKRAIDAHLNRNQMHGYTVGGLYSQSMHVCYGIVGKPAISIVIANKNAFEPLRRLLESIEERSTYKHYELIIVDHASNDVQTLKYYRALERNKAAKILYYTGEYNQAAIRNFAAKEANGELLLFLDHTLEVDSPDFLQAMLTLAQHEQVGVVGGKLLTPEGTIVSAGVVVGLLGWAKSIYFGQPDTTTDLLQNRFTNTVRNVAAVDGSCMMIRRDDFQSVRGFDESLPMMGWDIELCIRLMRKQKFHIFTPYARFIKYRDLDQKSHQLTERNLQRCIDVYRPMLVDGDPFYNPNYDYNSVIPLIAPEPYEPLELNPGAKIGV